jgi:hypothetical protein
MPIATTIDAIRSSIVETIRGITPSYTPRSDERWRAVQQQKDVPSKGLRSFFVELRNLQEEGEIYGGCALHSADLHVWCSYIGLIPAEQQLFVHRDQQDLWQALHRAQIDGAPRFLKSPFEPENDEDGRLWGAHLFSTSFFLPLP